MNWTTANIPSQGTKVVIVTGASSGLGLVTTRELASKGAHVIMAVRNVEKGELVADKIRSDQPDAHVLPMALNLGSIASIKAFSDSFRASYDRLHLLINNAGIYANDGAKTDDGFGLMIGVNHLGHFALTGYLIDLLIKTQHSRIVTVSSGAHGRASIDVDAFHTEQKDTYGASKLANLLFALELQHRFEAARFSTKSLAADPGPSKTGGVQNMIQSQSNAVVRKLMDLVTNLLMQTPAMGALPILRAATDPHAKGGEYYAPGGFRGIRGYPEVADTSNSARDADLAQQLWERSVELTGVDYVALQRLTVS